MQLKENYQIYFLVGDNIKKYRKKNNLTQQDLARRTGYSSSFIKKIEGKDSPKNFSVLTLYNIAKALNIDIKCLFDNDDI